MNRIKLLEIINTREISILVWIILFILYCISKRDMRKSFYGVIKALFHYKILMSIFAMILYITIIILILAKLNFWSFLLLKESIVWTLITGFVLLMNSSDTSKQKTIFKKVFIDSFKIIVIIQFIANSYTFSLITEFILIPMVVFITLIDAFTENKEEYKNINTFVSIIMIIFGIVIIFNSIYMIKLNPDKFRTVDNVNKFWLPIILTILYLPFIYMIGLISNYEILFLRLNFGDKKSNKVIRYARCKLLLYCKINIKKQHEIMNMGLYNIMCIKTKEDVDDMIRCYMKNI